MNMDDHIIMRYIYMHFLMFLFSDLNHPNQFVAGLALCALGNISSQGIARDLAPEGL